MIKEELKEGDIFIAGISITFINKLINVKEYKGYSINLYRDNKGSFNKNETFTPNNLRKATPEEKHWLNECIRLDKFISKEEAMKNFIKEKYVKVFNIGDSYNSHPSAKEYGVINFQNEDNKPYVEIKKDIICKVIAEPNINNNDLGYALDYNGLGYLISQSACTPSTKEEYDAQFIVKEPEFVLPKKWCIRWGNKDNYNIINNYTKSFGIKDLRYYIENIHSKAMVDCEGNYYGAINHIPTGYTEITFEQFKKYVLKESNEESPIKLAEQGHKLYSLNEIYKALTKEYDKVDVEDILKVIKTIK